MDRSSAAERNDTVGLELRIETPENVVLSYQLAGPAPRMGAYAIDLALRVMAMFVISVGLLCSGVLLSFLGASVGLFLLLWFLMEWGYFVVCEGFFNGTTPGKHLLGLRVIHERGHPVTMWSAMIRNLLRAADAMPLYGPALISMAATPKLQRLGDLAAGTVVISERRVVLPVQPVILERIAPLSRDELGNTYVPSSRTMSLIDRYLGRRGALAHARGHELAAVLAGALANRIAYRGDPALVADYPMAFLARVYVTFNRVEEESEAAEPDPGTAARRSFAMAGTRR